MPQPVIETPIPNETMIEPKYLPNIQEKPIKNRPIIFYKRPRDNQNNLVIPPKVTIL